MSIATSVHRRTTLRTAAAISLLPFLDRLPKAVAADPGLLRFGPPEPFSFDGLIERAHQLDPVTHRQIGHRWLGAAGSCPFACRPLLPGPGLHALQLFLGVRGR